VDDAVIVGQGEAIIKVKQQLNDIFDIKDLGEASYFLSIEITRSKAGIKLSQGQYVQRILAQYNMSQCKMKETPAIVGSQLTKEGTPLPEDNQYPALVGSLLYLAVNTRPDISFAVGRLSRFMQNPTEEHMTAAKHVLRYLAKYPDLGLFYVFSERLGFDKIIRTYTDADFAGDVNSRKSTSGMVVLWGHHTLAWLSKLQPIVTTSTTEAEFVAAATGTKEALWVRKILSTVLAFTPRCLLKVDNMAACTLIKRRTAGVSGRTKHIDVQYMFVRDRHLRGDIEVSYVQTDAQLADMFTKSLTAPSHEVQRVMINMQ
jgi:hypothetical protein